MLLFHTTLSIHSINDLSNSNDRLIFPSKQCSRKLLIPSNTPLLLLRDILLTSYSLTNDLGHVETFKFEAARTSCLGLGSLSHQQPPKTTTIQFKTLLPTSDTLVLSSYAPGCFIRHSHPHDPNTSAMYSRFENVRAIQVFNIGNIVCTVGDPMLRRVSFVVNLFERGLRYRIDLELAQRIPTPAIVSTSISPLCTGGTDVDGKVVLAASVNSINNELNGLVARFQPLQEDAVRLHVERWFEGQNVCDVEEGVMQLWRAKVDWLNIVRDSFLKGHVVIGNKGCGWREPGGVVCSVCGIHKHSREIQSDEEEESGTCFRQIV
ncbi:hypothetical protein BCR33DRAFT_718373 [Rhizoclosmatium globosum]|uniref:Uncharacterized protein n=1 Tax=Rhizoclosmatium globosum TaxID=329046 RepID=A0A1Y2C789_9FUNG|nr:hypothetical protein BCR33DRAFT_718373 [Rhizoclosmatium globosum]|eukprot:ORY42175.1 hypothetical protein BCR33DRAFT_718373 [Rhizoclosmatium globosum]